MRVLLLGSMDNEKIPLALRKEHILYDHIADPEAEPPVLPDGVYDVIILFAGRMGKSVPDYLPQALTSLRENGISLPVLVLTAHLSARDRILILDAGADDVLSAPFQVGEMLARVRALSRRGPLLQPRLLTAGDLTLDRSHCMLRRGEAEVRLSGKEMQLVELFLLHPGQVLPRAMLQHKVWGPDNEFTYNNIEVYLSLVRRKLRAIGSSVQIHAERGVGYYMEA